MSEFRREARDPVPANNHVAVRCVASGVAAYQKGHRRRGQAFAESKGFSFAGNDVAKTTLSGVAWLAGNGNLAQGEARSSEDVQKWDQLVPKAEQLRITEPKGEVGTSLFSPLRGNNFAGKSAEETVALSAGGIEGPL